MVRKINKLQSIYGVPTWCADPAVQLIEPELVTFWKNAICFQNNVLELVAKTIFRKSGSQFSKKK